MSTPSSNRNRTYRSCFPPACHSTATAIGNFIRDALTGGPIVVQAGGNPLRSYRYGADMAVWVLAMLTRRISGRCYNPGSNNAIDIASLATIVPWTNLAAAISTTDRWQRAANPTHSTRP